MKDELAIPQISAAGRNITYAATTVFVLGGPLLFGCYVLIPALMAGCPPPTWTWGTLALAQAVILLLAAWASLEVYSRYSVVLSNEGISFFSIRGRSFIGWEQVERVVLRANDAYFQGAGRSAVVNLNCFKDTGATAKFVWSRVKPALRPPGVN